MPICGLLITLSSDRAQQRAALDSLSRQPNIELGVRQGLWLPVVVEAYDPAMAHYLHEWIEGLPGVERVDVIYVNFDSQGLSGPPAEAEAFSLISDEPDQTA